MTRLRVLLTEQRLSERGGAGLYMRDVAISLLRKGHRPVVYSPELGDVAADLRAATVPVVDKLSRLSEPPDVIHGQTPAVTMAALLHFPKAPCVYVCHSWEDEALLFPRVFRYVAVDEVCRDHLVIETGIPPERVKLLFNFADMNRFRPRGPLPAAPRRALIFSNGVAPGRGLEAIHEACNRAGLPLDTAGYGTNRGVAHPEDLLPDYDLVFAKARCAIEAMSVGCAVVVCDVSGLAGMVTTQNLPELRRLNFGRRSLTQPLDPGLIFESIRQYSAADATAVARTMRKQADLDSVVASLIELYESAIKENRRAKPDTIAEFRAVAGYLTGVTAARRALPAPTPPASFTAERAGPAATDDLVLSGPVRLGWENLQLAAGRIIPLPADLCEDSDRHSVTVRTSDAPWSYAVALELPDAASTPDADRAALLQVRLRVRGGPVGLGVLDDKGDFLVRRAIWDTDGEWIDVQFRLRRVAEAKRLVLQTWDQPVAAECDLEPCDLYRVGLPGRARGA